MLRKMLHNFNYTAWLPPNNEAKTNPSLVESPSHVLSSNWSRKTRANTYWAPLSCPVSPRRSFLRPDGAATESRRQRNLSRFGIKIIWETVSSLRNIGLKKYTGSSTLCRMLPQQNAELNWWIFSKWFFCWWNSLPGNELLRNLSLDLQNNYFSTLICIIKRQICGKRFLFAPIFDRNSTLQD